MLDEPMLMQLSEADRLRLCLHQLAEGGTNEKDDQLVRSFRSFVIHHQLIIGPLDLGIGHPLEEFGWLLLSVLIYHHGVAGKIFRKSLKWRDSHSLPPGIASLLKAVQRCKFRLFQERQKLGQSHKEFLLPAVDKCRYIKLDFNNK